MQSVPRDRRDDAALGDPLDAAPDRRAGRDNRGIARNRQQTRQHGPRNERAIGVVDEHVLRGRSERQRVGDRPPSIGGRLGRLDPERAGVKDRRNGFGLADFLQSQDNRSDPRGRAQSGNRLVEDGSTTNQEVDGRVRGAERDDGEDRAIYRDVGFILGHAARPPVRVGLARGETLDLDASRRVHHGSKGQRKAGRG